MYSVHGDLKEAGFPHSEISGSKPICRLPAAYRRLSRPSSPIIAKASTTCTYSLDPITLLPRGPLAGPPSKSNQGDASQSHSRHHSATGNSHACAPRLSTRHDAIHNPVSRLLTPSSQRRVRQDNYLHSRLLKSSRWCFDEAKKHHSTAHARLDAVSSGVAGGANRDRTDDLLLAKQALSQLSYGPAV
jgi:hypothetical protein